MKEFFIVSLIYVESIVDHKDLVDSVKTLESLRITIKLYISIHA